MRQFFALTILGVAVLTGATSTSSAALMETGTTDDWQGFGSINHFEIKNGGSSWEAAEKEGGTVGDSIDLGFSGNTETLDFTLTHDSTAEEVVLSLQSTSNPSVSGTLTYERSETATATMGFKRGWRELQLLTKTTSDASSTDMYNVKVDRTGNGSFESITTNLFAAPSEKKGVYLTSDEGPFKDFVVQGVLDLSWNGSLSDAASEGFIGMSKAVPTPSAFAGGLLLLSGVGFGRLRRRQRSA